ncbi:uncharacterized protein LOC108627739 [Ceratina calcarata]|uniref:Uncharacterized protein LOC108627739 n=1 Tax=Ceratina calcarata TaxID=156304 RepID=A0AAJ7NA96_9HYME|nr:uncharacterized protein LOC108627739 [Ceratina calcarata]XP_017884640.1 uncharacterized protein LOC108627739 [Ceratina calcarata]
MSRRPIVSVYDYPEHLNPFNDEIANVQPHLYRDGKTKDAKHKFWTFGRGKKKRSHSFSIKSTWNGLFGKRKDDKPEAQEKKSTITTVSTTYKRDSYIRVPPAVPPRVTKDQQDFDDALGTLVRRRKYTLDNSSSRYGSNLTVNGDPARIYDGSPKDTTTSIMGDLTPKPPARKFGQVSPRPRDKIPALDFDSREQNENDVETPHEEIEESTPVPPMRRFGYRASQRTSVNTLHPEEEACRSGDTTISDENENENVLRDYAFKRYSQDAHRKSNLSINSCVSVGSTMSSFGRKKRRAPQPPRRDDVETNETSSTVPEATSVELRIIESSDITKVTENIDDLTKKTERVEESKEKLEVNGTEDDSMKIVENNIETSCDGKNCSENNSVKEEPKMCTADEEQEIVKEDAKKNEQNDVQIEYRRNSQENIEIIKDVDNVCFQKKGSTSSLSRNDSFSVKEEIEKIEKAIKELESANLSDSKMSEENGQENRRHLILENRRHFFQNMVGNEKNPIKIEFKEFPREQKEIRVVRLNESPVPEVTPRDPVKVVELHISEPIRQRPEILEDVNPIPKPRRYNSLNLKNSHGLPNPVSNGIGSIEPVRGKSL